MITPEAMREMADKLQAEHDFLISTLPIKSPSGAQTIESEAAAMLRSIAAEREAETVAPASSPDCFSISGKVKDGDDKGKTVWLYWSKEAGGWWQWSTATGWAYRFTSKDDPRFKDAWTCAKGEAWLGHTVGPWYYMPGIETIECVPSPSQETKGAE